MTMESCLYRSSRSQQPEVITNTSAISEDSTSSPPCLPSSSSSSSSVPSNTKSATVDPSKQSGILWRMTSGVFNTASGAVGAGVGGVRWVAGKTYNISAAVASKVPVPSLASRTKKDKNE